MSDDGYRWKAFGARIRGARIRAGLTQKELAELVGVRPHTAWCWEAGRMRPQHQNLVEIAYHTRTSPEELEGRDALEAELLREAELSFRDAVNGLPLEDIESIRNYIRFIRSERRRRRRAEGTKRARPRPQLERSRRERKD